MTDSRQHIRVAASLAAVIALVPALAGAQDTRRRDEPRQAQREVREEIQRDVRQDVERDVQQMLRELQPVLRDLAPMARDLTPLARQIAEAVASSVNGVVLDGVRAAAEGARPFANADARRALGAFGDDDQDREFRAEQTDRQVKTLTVGATGALDLRNISGDITVTAGGGRNATVEIIRRSRGRTDADARLGLERVTVQVDDRADRASLSPQYPAGRQPFNVSITYNVTAPEGMRVSAHSVSGDVIVRNIKGDVDVQVTSGDITVTGARRVSEAKTFSGSVTLADVDSDGTIAAGTMSGDVAIDRLKARRLEVDVTSGNIDVRTCTCDSAVLKSLSGDIDFGGALAKGGRYELQSFSGTVTLTPPANAGFELQASTFNGDITVDRAFDVKGATRTRRSLRGTVGDGGASVSVTTFNGDVVVTRK